MRLGLVASQEDRVPRRPLLILVPAHQRQVKQVRVLAERTAALPDRQHQTLDINRLTATSTHHILYIHVHSVISPTSPRLITMTKLCTPVTNYQTAQCKTKQ